MSVDIDGYAEVSRKGVWEFRWRDDTQSGAPRRPRRAGPHATAAVPLLPEGARRYSDRTRATLSGRACRTRPWSHAAVCPRICRRSWRGGSAGMSTSSGSRPTVSPNMNWIRSVGRSGLCGGGRWSSRASRACSPVARGDSHWRTGRRMSQSGTAAGCVTALRSSGWSPTLRSSPSFTAVCCRGLRAWVHPIRFGLWCRQIGSAEPCATPDPTQGWKQGRS
jgi:hypothetical protein